MASGTLHVSVVGAVTVPGTPSRNTAATTQVAPVGGPVDGPSGSELAAGLEPATARLQVGCATSCAMPARTAARGRGSAPRYPPRGDRRYAEWSVLAPPRRARVPEHSTRKTRESNGQLSSPTGSGSNWLTESHWQPRRPIHPRRRWRP